MFLKLIISVRGGHCDYSTLTPKKCSYDTGLFYVFYFFSKKKKSTGQFKSLCRAAHKGARKGSQARKKDTRKRK